MVVKRLRVDQAAASSTMVDKFTYLPESLQLHILSSLDTRQAVQTSVLSKSWASAWTGIHILNFSSLSFNILYFFDEFVTKTLSLRQSVKLDKLIFKRHGICGDKILKIVFDYAFSECVEELEVDVERNIESKSWPIWLHTSSDSLISLKLNSFTNMVCPFLGPRSGSFKSLTNLHLTRVTITELDPFSGFPALDKLKMYCCRIKTNGRVLNVHALQLSELTIRYYNHRYVRHCELKTPKLRYFEFRGTNFPRMKILQCGLPVLDTFVIDFTGYCRQKKEMIMLDDLLMLLNSFYNAKTLTVLSAVFHLLSFFPDELANQSSPFRDLKCLKLDFSFFLTQHLFESPCKMLSDSLRLLPDVKAYFMQNSHDAKCTVIYPGDSNARSNYKAIACRVAGKL